MLATISKIKRLEVKRFSREIKLALLQKNNMAMTRKEMNARYYRNKRENGLCVSCGKPLDREGIYCIACNEKSNKGKRESRAWYREHKICYQCGKNPVINDEKKCLECRAKNTSIQARRREQNREEYNEKQKNYHRKIYYERIEKGICIRCGKVKADDGFRSCALCRAKLRRENNERNRNKRQAEFNN